MKGLSRYDHWLAVSGGALRPCPWLTVYNRIKMGEATYMILWLFFCTCACSLAVGRTLLVLHSIVQEKKRWIWRLLRVRTFCPGHTPGRDLKNNMKSYLVGVWVWV